MAVTAASCECTINQRKLISFKVIISLMSKIVKRNFSENRFSTKGSPHRYILFNIAFRSSHNRICDANTASNQIKTNISPAFKLQRIYQNYTLSPKRSKSRVSVIVTSINSPGAVFWSDLKKIFPSISGASI